MIIKIKMVFLSLINANKMVFLSFFIFMHELMNVLNYAALFSIVWG